MGWCHGQTLLEQGPYVLLEKSSSMKQSQVISFLGLCNKSPQTAWLKTTETVSVTVLGARNLKSIHPEALEEILFSVFQLSAAAGIPWLVATSLQSQPPWSH